MDPAAMFAVGVARAIGLFVIKGILIRKGAILRLPPVQGGRPSVAEQAGQ
jgi:hypothetical protein